MEYIKGNEYHNFLLKDIYNVEEMDSTVYLFSHIRSKARLLYARNNDDNKVFSITFRTPPEDNSGTPHIMEHSVLCGSEKYPLKEPFVELMKSSLNTFLNAMTFSDKTMYPVASQNESDFMNLMDVYLDAVFNPLIYKNEHILMQEGWHYHIENESDEIVYNGVVYNEMKGAFSSGDEILYRNVQASLYPDTAYGFESGGDPEYIPELTNEKFLNFHKKYYHPSNSYIYIYGDGDMDKHLDYLDRKYLSKYEAIEVDSKLTFQKPFKEMNVVDKKYPATNKENLDKQYYFAYNFSVSDALDTKTSIGLNILAKILFDSDAAPLKEVLIKEKIADEILCDYSCGMLQPMFSIIAKNADKEKEESFINIIKEKLAELVKEGIDKELIEANFNNFEFELKEGDSGRYPKGLIYGIDIMESWLYDGNPVAHVSYNKYLKEIENEMKDGYFEALIKEYFLDNTHTSFIRLAPSLTLEEEKEREIESKLKTFKESLNEEEIKILTEKTNELLKIQNTPDSEEAKNLIPSIKVSEIKKEPAYYDMQEIKEIGGDIYIREEATKGITYLDINYAIPLKTIEEGRLLRLFSICLSDFKTTNYSEYDLNTLISLNLGDIDFTLKSYQNIKDLDKFKFFFSAYAKAFNEKEDKMYMLITEILENTNFDDKEKLKKTVKEELSKMQTKISGAAHTFTVNVLQSSFRKMAKFSDEVEGRGYYNYLKEIDADFDVKADEIINGFGELKKKILSSKKDIIITCDKGKKETSIENAKKYLSAYEIADDNFSVDIQQNKGKNLGMIIPSKVQYVGLGYNFRVLGFDYDPSLLVLKKYLSTEYLWNNVRVIGGAYGAFLSIDKFGNLCFVSYRDPKIKETVETYKNTPDVIKNFDLKEEELNKLIIGTMSDIDMPIPVYNKIKIAMRAKYTGDSYENMRKRRNVLLSVKKEDITGLYELFKKSIDNSNIVVTGSKSTINKNKELFDDISEIF